MVYINHRYKIIVLENPKSGSTSLMKSLEKSLNINIRSNVNRNKNIHMTSFEAQKEFAEYWDIYLKITSVRDPLERFISSVLMTGNIARYDPEHLQHGTPLNVESIVKYYIKNKDKCCYCRSQNDYTTGMDILINIDNFQEDYDSLCDKLGILKISIPHLNKNKNKIQTDIDYLKIYTRIY
jgi:hypothetical protein